MQSPGHAGELNSSKELQKFALEAFPSYVTRLTAATLERFMASDPLRPKARHKQHGAHQVLRPFLLGSSSSPSRGLHGA